jgi:hypothetical protein
LLARLRSRYVRAVNRFSVQRPAAHRASPPADCTHTDARALAPIHAPPHGFASGFRCGSCRHCPALPCPAMHCPAVRCRPLLSHALRCAALPRHILADHRRCSSGRSRSSRSTRSQSVFGGTRSHARTRGGWDGMGSVRAAAQAFGWSWVGTVSRERKRLFR